MSFGTMARFRVGYWVGVRSYILRERRDVSNRIRVITTEIDRIGKIEIEYESISNPMTGRVERTEKRVGISVTPRSSLEKMLKAYIALGGNPLDISQFFYAGESEIVGTDADGAAIYKDKYPYGGAAAPVSRDNDTTNEVDPNHPEDMPSKGFGDNPGGYVNLVRYAPRRLGGRQALNTEHAVIARLFEIARTWCNQEIKEKLQRMEHKIIKLCDLREQLEKERDIILQQAFGGLIDGLGLFDSNVFAATLRTQSVIADIDAGLFQTLVDGTPILNAIDEAKVSAVNWAYKDDPTESVLDLMA